MICQVRIYAKDGKVSAFSMNTELPIEDGEEVKLVECNVDDIAANIEKFAPGGVGSAWTGKQQN